MIAHPPTHQAEMSVVKGKVRMQDALLLKAPKERYELSEIPLPSIQGPDELLIRVDAIGLNPVDWKSADFGFGLPTLPALNGRDLAGTVLSIGSGVKRFRKGDRVFGPSTNYRDYRTSAFQQFAIASEHCLGAVPDLLTLEECAAVGVGAVTAALAIGSALGIPIRHFAPRELAIGAEGELEEWMGTPPSSPKTLSASKEWFLIWGGSTVTGFFAAQFAQLAGYRVIAVADVARHRERLQNIGVEHVIDRNDPIEAVEKIRRITAERPVRYALDCIGRETATSAMSALATQGDAFLAGLSGLPKVTTPNVKLCEVPVKTFHTNAAVGRGLMHLLEELLKRDEVVLPQVEIIEGGLKSVNGALDRLRIGDLGFGRLVVRCEC